jgi:hypothetical protein
MTVAVIAGSLALIGVAPASAAGNGVYVACGDYDTSATATGSGCETLSQALSDALTFGSEFASPATIELMPGGYCARTLDEDSRRLTLVGIGAAGLANPTSFSGPEAALTSFGWDPNCTGPAPAYALAVPDHSSQLEGDLYLENLAVDGSATGAPANGIYSNNAGLTLQNVLAENFTSGTGLTFTASGVFVSQQLAQMGVSTSAFVDNQTGVDFGVEGSIDESTIAGNTGVGLKVAGAMHLDNDTISHNGTGVAPVGGSTVQMDNSIVGDNTTDCSTTSGMEPGGVGGANGNNLLTASCESVSNPVATDITLSPDTVAAVADNGGPTPSMLPPGQASGGSDAGLCNSAGTDQREYREMNFGGPCDIGSVNTDNSVGTADPEPSSGSLDFGAVPTDQQSSIGIEIQNLGGNLMGVSGLAVTGDTAFSVPADNDGCSYFLVRPNGSCTIYVSAAPATQAAVTGQLVVHTTAGEIDIPLSVTGAEPVGSPTHVTAGPGNRNVSLSWTAAPGGGQTIEGYDIQDSTDNGSTWNYLTFSDASPATITDLDNGTTYLFRVAAQDAFGDGPWSDPSTAVTPHAPLPHASKLTTPHAATIRDGAKVTLSTTLADSTTHSPLAGATVTLLGRSGSGPFTTVATAFTDGQGKAGASVHPGVNSQYKWSYAGTSGHAATTTAAVAVSVAQVVHAALSASHVKAHKRARIYGTVSPSETGKSVALQELLKGKWKTLTTATIKRQKLPNGKKTVGFLLSVKPVKKGTETLRVSRSATSANVAGVSQRLKLKVT